MKQLEDFFYLTEKHGEFIGWVSSAQDGLRQLMDKYHDMTASEMAVSLYTMQLCFKYKDQPTGTEEHRVGYTTSDGLHIDRVDNFNLGDAGILSAVTPNMFKGNSAVLGTLFISGKEVIMIRRSRDQALSISAYIGLIRKDITDYQETGKLSMWRENASRPVYGDANPVRYFLVQGDCQNEISNISADELSKAGAELDENAIALLDNIEYIRMITPLHVVSVPTTYIWCAKNNGEIYIGRYPVTYGKYKDQFIMLGHVYPALTSNLTGNILQFFSACKSYIVRVEEQ